MEKRRKIAAKFVTAAWRRRIALRRMLIVNKLIKFQAMFRAMRTRKWLLRWHPAAIRIQALCRGYQTRFRMKVRGGDCAAVTPFGFTFRSRR